MKQVIKLSLLSVIAFLALFTGELKAQDASKELMAFTKQFEAAYNKQDASALKDLYTATATRTGPDGKVQNSNDSISAMFADFFKANKVTIELKQASAVTEKDGSVTATGNYHVLGTNAAGEKIERSGTYTNTLVKEKEHWKISKSVVVASKQ